MKLGEEAGVVDEAMLERLVLDPGGGVDVVDMEVEEFRAEAGDDLEGGVVIRLDGGGFGPVLRLDLGDEFGEAALVADVDGGSDLRMVDGLDETDEGIDRIREAGFDGEAEAEFMGAVGPAADEFDVLGLAGWKGFAR